MSVAFVDREDFDYLFNKDHIDRDTIEEKIDRHECIIAHRDEQRVGFLRYNYF